MFMTLTNLFKNKFKINQIRVKQFKLNNYINQLNY